MYYNLKKFAGRPNNVQNVGILDDLLKDTRLEFGKLNKAAGAPQAQAVGQRVGPTGGNLGGSQVLQWFGLPVKGPGQRTFLSPEMEKRLKAQEELNRKIQQASHSVWSPLSPWTWLLGGASLVPSGLAGYFGASYAGGVAKNTIRDLIGSYLHRATPGLIAGGLLGAGLGAVASEDRGLGAVGGGLLGSLLGGVISSQLRDY